MDIESHVNSIMGSIMRLPSPWLFSTVLLNNMVNKSREIAGSISHLWHNQKSPPPPPPHLFQWPSHVHLSTKLHQHTGPQGFLWSWNLPWRFSVCDVVCSWMRGWLHVLVAATANSRLFIWSPLRLWTDLQRGSTGTLMTFRLLSPNHLSESWLSAAVLKYALFCRFCWRLLSVCHSVILAHLSVPDANRHTHSRKYS